MLRRHASKLAFVAASGSSLRSATSAGANQKAIISGIPRSNPSSTAKRAPIPNAASAATPACSGSPVRSVPMPVTPTAANRRVPTTTTIASVPMR